VISDAHGIPLAVSLTGGNRNDITQLIPLLQAIRQSAAAADGPGSARMPSAPTAATITTSTGGRSGTRASIR
jgi:hypothetical protein